MILLEKVGEVCFTTDRYNLKGDLRSRGNKPVSNELKEAANAFYLSDGTAVIFGAYVSDTNVIDMYVDLPAKKRILGKTEFYFYAYPYKIVPDGNNDNDFNNACKPTGSNINLGKARTAWIIYNKNMDYLHCPDELSWSGKTKCD